MTVKMSFLKKIIAVASISADHFIAALMGSMFLVFILQVVFRYFLNLPVGWTVEWVTIAWLWSILFSFAFTIKTDEMIRLDLIYSAVSNRVKRWFDIFTGLTCALIFAWTLPDVWDYVSFMSIERSAYMRIPMNWLFSIYIPFHVAVIFRMLLVAWRGATMRYPSGPSENGNLQ